LPFIVSLQLELVILVNTVDHRNFFWTKGIINIFIDYLNKQLSSDKPDEIGLEYSTLIIYNLSIESCNIY